MRGAAKDRVHLSAFFRLNYFLSFSFLILKIILIFSKQFNITYHNLILHQFF